MEADGNQVWALVRNADDLPALTRFRIEPALPERWAGRGGNHRLPSSRSGCKLD